VTSVWYWLAFAVAVAIFTGGYVLARMERRRQDRREHERWQRRQMGGRR